MTDGRAQSPVRPPVVVAACLLVAAAVMLVVLRSWLDQPAEVPEMGGKVSVAAEVEPVESLRPVFEPEPLVEAAVTAPPQVVSIGVPGTVAPPAEPIRVIMLPVRVENPDPAAAVVTEAVRQSALRALRAMPNIDVVELGSGELAAVAPPNAGPLSSNNILYLAVTRRYEARVVAEISEQSTPESPAWVLTLNVRRPNGGGGNGGNISKSGDQRPGSDAESLGIRYADRIARDAERVASEGSAASAAIPAAAEARNVLLDPTRSETEILRSLSQLLQGAPDSASIAAAVDLAMRSTSAQVRLRVWMLLRRSAYDATLAQPLSYALLSDTDAAVRKEAALALTAYTGDAAARAALELAARNDSSPDVRLAAQMAAMDFEAQQAFKRATLLDRSLTPAERLAPTIVDSNFRPMGLDRSSNAAAAEDAQAYAEIMTAVEDPELKLRAVSQLQQTMMGAMMPIVRGSNAEQAQIVDALIETSRHADERVRRQALSTLGNVMQVTGNAEARAVLESVLENEPGLAEELRIADMLERQQSRTLPR